MEYSKTKVITESKNPNWKGGKYNCGGYIKIKVSLHPNRDKRGYILEHRLVMEHHLGRYLEDGEFIHHKNGIKTDNRLENLELMSSSNKHAKKHMDSVDRDEKGRIKPADPMLEEIKVRLYDKDSGFTKEYSLSKLINTSYRRGKFEFRGRGTGLKDKNGKIIYEGDYISWVCKTKENGEILIKGVIRFESNNARYYLEAQPVEYAFGKDFQSSENLEIIGNIHE